MTKTLIFLVLFHKYYTLIVRKMLKPLCAVLIMTPGNCLCQCNSLMSVCPWCMNNNWGGTSGPPSGSLSFSTDKSQIVIWLSDPEAAKTELSLGFHSIDVIGAVWCLKKAAAFPDYKRQWLFISIKIFMYLFSQTSRRLKKGFIYYL